MSVFDSVPTTPVVLPADQPFDEPQLAAVAFLARYCGRTLDSYRADLRQFFQWASDVGVPPLAATRARVELYRSSMDERGLAASTVDRRLSTVCGYYRFAHIDGRISANPAQYVRRPRVHPAARRGMDRGELAAFLHTAERISPAHAALAVLFGVERAAGERSLRDQHRGSRLRARTSHAAHRRQGQSASHRAARASHRPHTRPRHRRAHRRADPAALRRGPAGYANRLPVGLLIGKRAGLDHVHPHMLRAAFIMAALDAGVPLRDVQLAARHADPRTTTVYDRRRQNFDRHAAYAVVAFVTSG